MSVSTVMVDASKSLLAGNLSDPKSVLLRKLTICTRYVSN